MQMLEEENALLQHAVREQSLRGAPAVLYSGNAAMPRAATTRSVGDAATNRMEPLAVCVTNLHHDRFA